jgi:hypothetical protein
VFLNGTTIIQRGTGGTGKRSVDSGTECKVSWDVEGKGSSYEVHVTTPAHAKRDRSVEKTSKEFVTGGFAPFTA